MGIKLEKAIESSENGYISSDDEIEDIMAHFTQITVNELISHNANCQSYLNGFRDELHRQKLPPAMLKNCTLLELLWLTDKTSDYPISSAAYENRTYCLASMRYIIRSLEKSHSWVSLFLSINLDDFIRYHNQMKNANSRSFLLSKIHRLINMYLQCDIDDSTTIGQLLYMLEKGMATYWCPWQNKQQYHNQIKGYYEILDLLLVDCVKGYNGYSKTAMAEKAAALNQCETSKNELDYPF